LITPPSGNPTTLSWDANGNVTLENQAGALTTYGWDDENRLAKVASGAAVEAYCYAADGKRRRIETADRLVLLVWDGENLLLESDGALVTHARWSAFADSWGGVVSQRVSGVSSFYGLDLQRTVRVLVSTAGLITDRYAFKAFGEELSALGSTQNPFRYGGAFGYYRNDVNRLTAGLRDLSASYGRWLSRGLSSGLERWDSLDMYVDNHHTAPYVYAYNRPTTLISPSGAAAMATQLIARAPARGSAQPPPPNWGPPLESCEGQPPWVLSCMRDAIRSVCEWAAQTPTHPGSGITDCFDPIGHESTKGMEVIQCARRWCNGLPLGGAPGTPVVKCSPTYGSTTTVGVGYCHCHKSRGEPFYWVGLVVDNILKPTNQCGSCRERMIAVLLHELLLHVCGCYEHPNDDGVCHCIDTRIPIGGRCSICDGLEAPK
jgi:YD repeat-containing protein